MMPDQMHALTILQNLIMMEESNSSSAELNFPLGQQELEVSFNGCLSN